MDIVFSEADGVYSGVGTAGRRWLISPTVTGWRLEFIDIGDDASTFAGVHRSVAAAQNEANA